MRLRFVFSVVSTVVVLEVAACGLRSPGSGSGGSGGETAPGPADDRLVETFATPLEVLAGDTVTVRCVVRRDGQHLPDEATAIDVTPGVGTHLRDDSADGTWTITPTAAGAYLVQCRTEDGAVVDEQGVHLLVEPAAPVVIETTLDVPLAEAGTPVGVTCEAFDTYGNLIAEPRPTGLVVDAELSVDPPSGTQFIVRGTLTGDYSVACELDTLIDDTPETLTIVPGIPAASVTTVDRTDIGPTDVVNVSCDVTDAYGNSLAGVATTVYAMAADGSLPADNGLTTTDTTMSATRVGTYYVFCMVPGFQAGDESPAIIHVGWGLPCTWVADVQDLGCLWQGRRLPIDFAVYDFWGNEVENAAIAPTDPGGGGLPGVASDGQGGWVFGNEGLFDVRVSVVTPPDMDPACASVGGNIGQPYDVPFSVIVDSTGPQFDITSPPRASMMVNGGAADTSITIDGTVTDTVSFITGLALIGNDLAPAGNNFTESFSVNQISRWGLSIIDGVAVDECGNRSVIAQSYLRSGAYFGAFTFPEPTARAARGIIAHLNQPVIDDGDRTTLNDMASIGETIISTLDWDTIIQSDPPLAENSAAGRRCSAGCCFWCDTWAEIEYELRRDPDASVYIEGPVINSLVAVNGGISFDITINQIDFPLTFWARDRDCACGIGPVTIASISGSAVAGANWARATGVLGVTIQAGAPSATVSNLNLTTNGLYLNISCPGWLQFICDGFTGLLISVFKPTIEGALQDAIVNEMPPLIEGMLGGFTLDTGFDIPPPTQMRLEMSSGLDRIVFCGANAGIPKPPECPATNPNPGYGQLGLYSQVYPGTRGSGISASSRGTIQKGGALPTFSSSAYNFGMGIKDDMFNQLLWALWYGGGLDLDWTDLEPLLGSSGIQGVNLSFHASLPPVGMPGRNGNQIEIGLGDVYMDASVDLAALLGGSSSGAGTLNVSLYLSTIIGATLTVLETVDAGGDPVNEFQIDFDQNPQIFVEVVNIDDPGYQGLMSDLFQQILEILLPNLLGGVLSSFPIPEIDLGGIVNLPSGADSTWTLSGVAVDRTSDYYRLTGSLD